MPDVVTFDPINLRIIEIDAGGDNEIEWQEVYSEWKDYLALDVTGQNLGYPQAFRVVGGDPISATRNLGSTFFILRPWKFRPAELDHRLQANGNLFPDPEDWQLYEDTLGDFTVLFVLAVSNLVDTIVTGGGGGATPEEIWALDEAVGTQTGMGRLVGQIFATVGIIDQKIDALGSGSSGAGGIDCAITPQVIPSVFVGHKGDKYEFPVYRADALISESELAGATDLQVRWENEDTQQTILTVAGVAVEGSNVTYTTTNNDLIFETAGRWVGQASGTTVAGEPFKSQQLRVLVEVPVQ